MSICKRMQMTRQIGIVVVVLSVAALTVVSASASSAVSEPYECNVVEDALGTQVARNGSEAALSDAGSLGHTTDEGSISDPALLVLDELTTLLDQSSRLAPTIVDGRLQASCEITFLHRVNIPGIGIIYDFRQACKGHDYCYDLGHPDRLNYTTVDRLDCDDTMYDDMKYDCSKRSIHAKLDCYASALAYYDAVRAFGWWY